MNSRTRERTRQEWEHGETREEEGRGRMHDAGYRQTKSMGGGGRTVRTATVGDTTMSMKDDGASVSTIMYASGTADTSTRIEGVGAVAAAAWAWCSQDTQKNSITLFVPFAKAEQFRTSTQCVS